MKSLFLALCLAVLVFAENGTVSFPNFKGTNVDSSEAWVLKYLELSQKGISLHDDGFYKEAIDVFREALKIVPKEDGQSVSSLNFEIAFSFQAMQQMDSALFYGKESIKQFPNDLAYSLMGDIYDGQNKTDSALAYYNAGLEKFPTSYWLLYNKSVTQEKNGDTEGAYATIKESIKHTYDHEGSFYLAALLATYKFEWINFFANGAYSRIIGDNEDRDKLFVETIIKLIKAKYKDNSELESYFTPFVHEGWINSVFIEFYPVVFNDKGVKEEYKGKLYEQLVCFGTIAMRKSASIGYDFQLRPLYKEIVKNHLEEAYIRLVFSQSYEVEFNVWKNSHQKEMQSLLQLLNNYWGISEE